MARCRVYEKLDEAFHFLCVIATVALLIWCCIEYSKNDDLVQISFKKFGLGNEMTYPDISMCLKGEAKKTEMYISFSDKM